MTFYLVTVLFIGKETVFWAVPFATRELCIKTRAESVLVSTRSGSVVSYCTDKRPREDGSDLLVQRRAKVKPARRKRTKCSWRPCSSSGELRAAAYIIGPCLTANNLRRLLLPLEGEMITIGIAIGAAVCYWLGLYNWAFWILVCAI